MEEILFTLKTETLLTQLWRWLTEFTHTQHGDGHTNTDADYSVNADISAAVSGKFSFVKGGLGAFHSSVLLGAELKKPAALGESERIHGNIAGVTHIRAVQDAR